MDWSIQCGAITLFAFEDKFNRATSEDGLTSRFTLTHTATMTARRSCCTVTSLLYASDASSLNVPTPTDNMNLANAMHQTPLERPRPLPLSSLIQSKLVEELFP